MKKYLLKTVLITLGSCFFMLSPLATKSVHAASDVDTLNKEIQAKRQKIKNIEKQIAERKSQINSAKAAANSLKGQITILDNHITQVELDVEATSEKLETLTLEIELLEAEVEILNENIERQKNIIGEFIRNIHTDGHKSMLEIIALYDSFSDFYSQLQYLQTIEHDLSNTAKVLSAQKKDIVKKQTAAQERKKSYLALEQQLDQKKKDLGEQVYAKEDLYVETKKSEKTYQTLLSSLKKEYQAVENEISSIEREVRKRLEAQKKLQPTDNKKLSWPVPSRYVTARFRDPTYPYRNVFEHNAIDIRAAHGTALRAASDGYVARARRCSTWRCYSYTMLIHANGISTVYGHMSKIVVAQDQFVKRGQIIGYSGGTPRTPGAGPFVTGAHLHFEVRKNGIPVNPISYLVKDW